MEPGSLVRSSTAMLFTVLGRAFRKSTSEYGRYRRTLRTPTLAPPLTRKFTVSSTVSAPEAITITILSASGAPT